MEYIKTFEEMGWFGKDPNKDVIMGIYDEMEILGSVDYELYNFNGDMEEIDFNRIRSKGYNVDEYMKRVRDNFSYGFKEVFSFVIDGFSMVLIFDTRKMSNKLYFEIDNVEFKISKKMFFKIKHRLLEILINGVVSDYTRKDVRLRFGKNEEDRT